MKVQVCGCPCERRRCPFIPLCVTQCCYKHSAYDRSCAPSEHCEVISKKYKFNLSCWVTNGLFPHVCGQTWQPVLWYTLTKCSFTWHGTIAVIQGENEGFIYHRHTLSLYPVSVVSLYSDLSHFLCTKSRNPLNQIVKKPLTPLHCLLWSWTTFTAFDKKEHKAYRIHKAVFFYGFSMPTSSVHWAKWAYVKTVVITIMKWNHDIVQMMCFRMVAKVTSLSKRMHDVQNVGMSR